MSDRELLEDAAKAAGMRVGYEPDGKERGRYDLYWSNVHHQLAWHGKRAGSEYPRPIFWNPLTDDGDALRLAVRLRKLPVIERWSDGHDWVFIPGHEGGALPLGTDPFAATRRAIVRAAAEIGRSKE